MEEHHVSQKHDERLSRLEGIVEGLAKNLSGLEGAIASLSSKLDNYISYQNESAVNRGKVNWGWIVAGVMLVLYVGEYAGRSNIEPLNQRVAENEHELDTMWEEFFDGLKWRGSMEERVLSNRERSELQVEFLKQCIEQVGKGAQ